MKLHLVTLRQEEMWMGNLPTICITENNEINKYKEALSLNINVWVWVLYIFLPLLSSGKHKNKIKKGSKYLNLLRKCYKFQEEHLKENDTGNYVKKMDKWDASYASSNQVNFELLCTLTTECVYAGS